MSGISVLCSEKQRFVSVVYTLSFKTAFHLLFITTAFNVTSPLQSEDTSEREPEKQIGAQPLAWRGVTQGITCFYPLAVDGTSRRDSHGKCLLLCLNV